MMGVAQVGQRGLTDHTLYRSQLAVAQVRLIEPRTGLLRKHAGEALAVEIYPLIDHSVQAIRQVLHAFHINSLYNVADHCLAVRAFQWRQRLMCISTSLRSLIAGLGERDEKRGQGVATFEIGGIVTGIAI